MLQRIQTLFLLAATILLGSLFFSKIAYSPEGNVKFTEIFPFLIFTIISVLTSFISIFLYRHRIIQIRFSIFNIIILIAYQAWILYFFFTRPEGSSFSIAAVFPIVAAILLFTAVRYIARDEALVRSTSRLRKK